MGVRIDLTSSLVKKGSTTGKQGGVAAKKDAAAQGEAKPEGTGDFDQALAKAQPKAKPGREDEAAADKPEHPGVKGKKGAEATAKVGKKQGKADAGQGPADDVEEAPDAPTLDAAANVAAPSVAVEAGAETDDEAPVADGVKHDDSPEVDPTTVVVGAPVAPVQVQGVSEDTPEETRAAAGVTDERKSRAVAGAPVEEPATQDDGGDEATDADAMPARPVVQGKRDENAQAKVVDRPVQERGGRGVGHEMKQQGGDESGSEGGETVAAAGGEKPAKVEKKFDQMYQAVTAGAGGGEDVRRAGDERPVERAAVKGVAGIASATDLLQATTAAAGNVGEPKHAAAAAAPAPVPVAPEVRFAEENHPKVVTAVRTQLLPGGGAMQLRLDPPDLGPLRLEVTMQDGEMSASFFVASDQAASLLTHGLGQLKHALEGAGISVDKLQVRQGSAEQFSDSGDGQKQSAQGQDQSSARQEQQRREMLNRMWQKVAGGDPLDLVA